MTELLVRQTFQWQERRDEWSASVPGEVVQTLSRLNNDTSATIIATLRDIFLNKKHCLIHGNLLPASLLTNEAGAAQVSKIMMQG